MNRRGIYRSCCRGGEIFRVTCSFHDEFARAILLDTYRSIVSFQKIQDNVFLHQAFLFPLIAFPYVAFLRRVVLTFFFS